MMELFLVRTKEMIELPTESLTWTGHRYKAARKIEGRIYSNILSEGDTVLFKWKGKEVFRGIVFGQQKKKDKIVTFRAYDMMQYMLANSDVYIFQNQRLDQIVTRVCRDFGIPFGTIANTSHTIKSLSFINETSLYDICLKALIETDKQTKRRYRFYSEKGKVQLQPLSQKDMWVLETGVNVEDFNLSTSIENTATQVKVITGEEENQRTVVVTDETGKARYGTLQLFERVSGEFNQAQLTERANNLLTKHKGIQKELDIQALGISEIVSGQAVFVNLENNIKNTTFYVDSDSHVFIGNNHTMKVHLVEENDLPEVE